MDKYQVTLRYQVPAYEVTTFFYDELPTDEQVQKDIESFGGLKGRIIEVKERTETGWSTIEHLSTLSVEPEVPEEFIEEELPEEEEPVEVIEEEISEEGINVDLLLLDAGPNKLYVVKAIKNIGLAAGLKEAKDLVDKCVIYGSTSLGIMPYNTAVEYRKVLEAEGARISIKEIE